MTDTVNRDVLRLPDFDDTDATESFIGLLEAQSTRHGVKKLLGHCEAILGYKEKIAQNIELAERALLVVNGIRTPLQAEKDKARSYRVTAEKFYETLSTAELSALCRAFKIEVSTVGDMRNALINYYVTARLSSFSDLERYELK